jgi:quercetin dioxygenase-like cupin family protein
MERKLQAFKLEDRIVSSDRMRYIFDRAGFSRSCRGRMEGARRPPISLSTSKEVPMLECIITETKDIEPVVYEWGGVKWVANNDLDPGCEQSFGLVHILPGKTNPEHRHTAADEILFMLQGECDVRLGDRHLKIGPGQTLYIPQGVKHEVANRGWEPVLYVCSFSASTRGTLFENPSAPGVRPLSGKSGQPW